MDEGNVFKLKYNLNPHGKFSILKNSKPNPFENANDHHLILLCTDFPHIIFIIKMDFIILKMSSINDLKETHVNIYNNTCFLLTIIQALWYF